MSFFTNEKRRNIALRLAQVSEIITKDGVEYYLNDKTGSYIGPDNIVLPEDCIDVELRRQRINMYFKEWEVDRGLYQIGKKYAKS